MKYLDFGGLVTFWNKLKEYFVTTESYEEDTLVVAAALTDLNERKLDAADLPSWASNDTKPTYTLDEVTDGNTRKLSDYLNKEDNTIPNIVPLYVKEYDYTCAASSTAEGFIFFGNVVPTSEDVGENWYIKFKLYVNLTSTSSTYSPNNKYCKGMYDCYVGASGTSNIYHYFNRSYSTSYRPIYHHLIANYATTTENGTSVGWTTKYANRATNPIKIGARIQSAYGDTQPRHYKIEVYEIHNCTFSFPDNIEKYGSVYTTAKYGNCAAISADAGLLESGDANDTSTVYLTYSLMKAGTNGIKAYSLIMLDKDGNWQSFHTSAGGTGVSKTINTSLFRLGSRIYKTTRTTDLAANNYFGTTQVLAYGTLTDFRYSFPGITANSLGNGLTYGKPMYVLGSLDSEGYFRLDTTKCWAQDEPTTEDGKIYIRVCEAVYSDYNQSSMPTGNYRGDLISDGYAYWYKDGLFLRYYPGVPSFVLNQLDKYKLEKDYSKEYLTTIALEDGTISFNILKDMGTEYITSISYSTDNGATWVTTNNVDNKGLNLIINVNVSEGDEVMWKGNAQQTAYYYEDEDDYIGSFFSSNCGFDIQGNIMSLLYGDNFQDKTTIEEDGAFTCLFGNYTQNTCIIVNAKNLVLPATTLTEYCYYLMFYHCVSLITAPKLPATTLAEYCYNVMFYGCTALTEAPELPATTLAESCYQYMFWNCTSLIIAPQLPATTLAEYCYYHMFDGCTGLTTAPELPATILTRCCYDGMFNVCRGLTTAPELHATTLAYECYHFMFANCTGLIIAPELPATTLADDCYSSMFVACTSLTTAPELPATILTNHCYENMFDNCKSLIIAPELPAIVLMSYCYRQMFRNCIHLKYIKCLATDRSASNCTQNWTQGVLSNGTFIKANTSWSTGNSDIPSGWTVYTESEYELVHKYELDAKTPLVIEIDNTDTTVPSGTYASIAAAIAEGREVIVKELLDNTEGSYFNYYMAEEQVSDPNDNMSYVFICPVEGHRQNVIYISQNSTYRAYINLAFEGHTHGYLKLSGALQTTDVTIANGDKLVITDSSNLNIIARASVTFDGSTTTKALSQKGTWETFLKSHQDISGKANLASPAFTGTPTAPTATAGTNTTQLATTAFVNNAINSFNIYGTSSTAASTDQKEVSIPSITTLNTGQIIIVQPSANSTAGAGTLKLNDFDAYPMIYNGSALTTDTDSTVWNSNYPSWWIFNGTQWVFAGRGHDANTTYGQITQDLLNSGTSTTARIITPKLIRDNFYTKSEIDTTVGNIETLLVAI